MKRLLFIYVLCILLVSGCVQTQPNSGASTVSSVNSKVEISSSGTSMTSSVKSEVEISSSAASSDIKSNGEYKYKIVDNSVTIVGYIGSATDVVIPDMFDGLPVKVIGVSAFEETDVQQIVLPNQIQKIEEWAFFSLGLREMFIPDSVIEIGETAFIWCPRSFVLLYDNNTLVPQYAKENNLLSFKRSEYNPVLDVELVGGKPLNDYKNLGISQEDYNRVSRQSMNDIEFNIDYFLNEANSFYSIAFDYYIENGLTTGPYLTQEVIKQKLSKIATLLYQCGITEFDPKTINTGKTGYLDKLVTASIYSRSPEQLEDDVIKDSDVRFADDFFLYTEAFGLFDFIPNASLVTGYSKQQHGIWYYPKELPKVTTEVLSFNGNLNDGLFTLKVKFTDDSGASCEKTFTYSLVLYNDVGGSSYRVMLKGIQ